MVKHKSIQASSVRASYEAGQGAIPSLEPLEPRLLLDAVQLSPLGKSVAGAAAAGAEIIGWDGDTSAYQGLADATPSGDTFMASGIDPESSATWIDAEKIPDDDDEGENPSITGTDDDLMCWAAAASNVLEWTGWGFAGGLSNTDEMFQYFQDHWTDYGCWPKWAWEWWFDGTDSSGSQPSSVDVDGGGFYSGLDFYDYYHQEDNDASVLSAINGYLKDGYGVTLGVFPSGSNEGHAITCWGFNYDPTDPTDYQGLWITDSDDYKSQTNPPDKLRYYEVANSGGKWHLQDFYGSDGWYISTVQALEPKPGNRRPTLTNPTVTPLSGDSADTYTFTVDYYDQDGDPPLESGGKRYANVYLSGGRSEEMSLVTGDPADGTYRCTIDDLALGNYQHFFSFIDTGGLDAVSGWHSGPHVGLAEGSALAHHATRWNDPLPGGDNDSIPEPGETLELRVKLRNDTGSDVEDVYATLSCNNGSIELTDSDYSYGTISPGEREWGNFALAANIANPVNVEFTVHVTYEQDGVEYYQDFSFPEDFEEVDHDIIVDRVVAIYDAPPDGDGDGVPESGEFVEFDMYLQNANPNGSSFARNVETRITNCNILHLTDRWYEYPDLHGGSGTPEKQVDPDRFDFHTAPIPPSFSGWVTGDVEVTYDGSTEPVLIYDDYPLFYVESDPWLRVSPGEWDFGVTGTAGDVLKQVTIRNYGSEAADVTDIALSHPDTSWAGPTLPFTLAAGASETIDVTIDTTDLSGQIQREVTVTSTARLPDSDKTMITGLVSDLAPYHEVPGAAPSEAVDIGGNIIVWAEKRNGSFNIYAYDLSTQTEHAICETPEEQWNPRIGNNVIAWEDGRNTGQSDDIYAYYFPSGNLADGQEIVVADHEKCEDLVGVDGEKLAFTRVYYEGPAPSYGPRNLYLYDVTTGDTEAVTTFSSDTMYGVDRRDSDFGGGILTWVERQYTPPNMWTYRRVMKLSLGLDPSPVHVESGGDPDRGPVANGGRIAWCREAESGPDPWNIWVMEASPPETVTSQESRVATANLALGNGMVAYDKEAVSGLVAHDLDSAETLFFDQWAWSPSLRMDGNVAVWAGGNEGLLYYAFLGVPDVTSSPGDITWSKEKPQAGEIINATVSVHNINSWDGTEDVTVQLYDGAPDDGGTQWGGDQVISDGISARGEASVTFSGLEVPADWEGTKEIYAVVSTPESENPANNEASKTLEVQDSDTEGPLISNVVVQEYNGDGDGIPGADEQAHISWDLSDPSLIGSTSLWIDLDQDGLGEAGARYADDEVALDGDYYAILGPLDSGRYDFAIDATDADVSPASSHHTGTLEVVPAEEVTVLYDGESIEDGETTPIDFGTAQQGGPAPQKVFMVRNDGEQALALGALSVPEGFTATGPASSVVQPGRTTHFTVTLDTSTEGEFGGESSLASSDGLRSPDGLDEGDFTFPVAGTVAQTLVDVELVPTTSLSADDILSDLPAGHDNALAITVGQGYYVEVWVRNTSDTPTGISGGYLDLLYATAFTDATGLDHGSIFDTLEEGIVDDPSGLVDDFGGVTFDTDKGDDEWVRLGWVEYLCTAGGTVTVEAQAGDPQFALAGTGENVPWDQVDLDSVQIEQIPGEVDVHLAVVETPTGTDTVSDVPTSTAQVVEDHEFWVEVWTRSDPANPQPIRGGTVNVIYDTQYAEAVEVDHGGVFTDGASGSIDDGSGLMVNLGGQTTRTDVGDNEFVLLGRVKMVGGAPVDQETHGWGPYGLGLGASEGDTAFSFAGSETVPSDIRPVPSAEVLAVVYDVNDSGRVDVADFSLFAPAFPLETGDPEPPYATWADFNGSGRVDVADFSLFAPVFGKYCHEIGKAELPPSAGMTGGMTGTTTATEITPTSPAMTPAVVGKKTRQHQSIASHAQATAPVMGSSRIPQSEVESTTPNTLILREPGSSANHDGGDRAALALTAKPGPVRETRLLPEREMVSGETLNAGDVLEADILAAAQPVLALLTGQF